MVQKENKFRKLQRGTRDATRALKQVLKKSDATSRVSAIAKEASALVGEKYKKSSMEKVLKPLVGAAVNSAKFGAIAVKKADQITGASERIRDAKETVNIYAIELPKIILSKDEVFPNLKDAGRETAIAYGHIRGWVKPYFAAEDAEELLLETERELTKIIACILQVSNKDASNWVKQFGKAVTAKIVGAGSVSLFGLVNTLGTAKAGVAITTLYGAASYSTPMAALSLGGGIAASGLVVSGFGLIIGLVAYKTLLSSSPRDHEDLSEEDKQIIETCALLAAAVAEKRKESPVAMYADEALQFRKALAELQEYLETNADRVCEGLDMRNRVKYRQHVLKDFKPAVLNRFKSYADKSPLSAEAIIGGVFYALHTQTALDGSVEEELVLEALRRSDPDLRDASEAELAEYLSNLTPAQQRGVANNVKGIYHELRYVEQYNATHEDTYAEVHSSPNHAGSDVVIRDKETGEVVAEYQLKATDSASYVAEHRVRYQHIEVLATEEVSSAMSGVESSGFSNAELTNTTDHVIGEVSDNTMLDRVTEFGTYGGLFRAGYEAVEILNGKSNLKELSVRTLRSAANAAAATGITAYLFG